MFILWSSIWVFSNNKNLNSYLASDQQSCTFSCGVSEYVNELKTKCVTTCPNKKSSDLKYCVASCAAGFFYFVLFITIEYEVDVSNVCKLCYEISTNLNKCLKCSSSTVCIECFNGYYLSSTSSNKFCLAACDPADANDKYISLDKKSCVTSCQASEALDRVGKACVLNCQDG